MGADAPARARERSAGLAPLCAGALLLLGFTSRLRYGYEWDELQLLQGAWNVAHGLVPYRDFFEHHPPLLHLLVAPLVGGLREASWPVLVAMRMAALGILGGLLLAWSRLLRRAMPSAAARWGPAALLVVCPLSGKLFELRADWLALLALLGALLLMLGERDTVARRPARVIGAGALGGLALCLTQKAILPWLGVLLWCAGRAAIGSERRAEAGRLAALVAGTLLPPVALAIAFAARGAGAALWDDVLAVNVGWPREVSWRYVWWESSTAAFGPLALALACVPAQLAGGGRVRALEGMAAVLLALGMVGYRVTPAPWEQAFLFLVVPWAAGLALLALARLVAPQGRGRGAVAAIGCSALLLAATLPAGLALRALAVWLAVAVAVWGWTRHAAPDARLQRAAAIALLPGIVLFAVDRGHDLRSERAGAQQGFARAVAAELEAGEPLLAMWDHVQPFRPIATYHWFAHEGVLRRFADGAEVTRRLDDEYVALVQRGVRVLIVNPDWLAEYLPRLGELVDRHCELLAEGYAGSDAYVCRGGGRR